MGLNVKELLLSIPLLVFILWVFAAPIPQQRIQRVCQPINWVGNIATSSTALATDGHTHTAVKWSDKLSYSCQYMVWRLFYQEEYNKAVKEGRVVAVPAGEPKPVAGTQVVSPPDQLPPANPQEVTKPAEPTKEGAATPQEPAPAPAEEKPTQKDTD